jgi:fatty acid desaturase
MCALAFLSLQTALMAALWTGYVHSWLLLYVDGWLAVSAANVKHNHMHRRTFRHQGANLLLDHWVGLMTGTTPCNDFSQMDHEWSQLSGLNSGDRNADPLGG